ncbi:ATP-dependent DNA helicase RecG [Mediterraneibacter sp. NSJ-151]|uniref:ATP-dependent DNA helicase RecG n=1 Tax=Mediterraneibacter sp. NSJ-151 TaxID=2897708 RepID=UPI001F0A234B|nr:ATP-dependent DNA helicase RecG [Mediterraneibacter sp. NSJ-151]MCH4278819.1 ATP-dependent DNA helicase RecG [Mediterraneibacter sp. NSJ-151]
MNETARISTLKGIGEKTEKIFQKAGIYTIGDLIRYFPRGYDVYEEPVPISELEEGKTMTVTGSIYGRIQVGGSPKMQITTVYLKDISGTLKVIWFRMPFLRNTLAKAGTITLRGRVIRKKEGLVMEHPEVFCPASKYDLKQDTLQPIYPLVTGLTNHAVMKAVRQVLEECDVGEGILPKDMVREYQLSDYRRAIYGIHFPKDKEEFYHARKRLVFEEFMLFILSLRMLKESEERVLNPYCFRKQPQIEKFLNSLPFELTDAQKTVWREIKNDMAGIHVMSRLVQGDVGSGKTIVALLAMMYAGLNGYQAAMMAPTEVLARQHFENINHMLQEYEISLKVGLLTGSMTARQKRMVYEAVEAGEIQLVIGTHALIQEKVIYKNLALVVTDEQHRFGVKQRESLANKGVSPHILVMSATPIPRTLAIIVYGDLDISVINELPKNRLPIKNCVVDTGYRNTAYRFIKNQIAQGRQCYVICPMVEESETLEVENVTDYTENLQEIMGVNIKVQCLHGKMKQSQKDEIMEAFSKNEIQVLVSTTVIEVGIDVPNSTVMLIENAERFGLAQLHQLRGRVGRGKYQSYCIFMSASKSKETKERLDILNKSNDGFFIASEDLRLRGPGDLFGIRQSGILDFKLGDVFQDSQVLQQASEVANLILEEDPQLEKEKYESLKQQVQKIIQGGMLETTL